MNEPNNTYSRPSPVGVILAACAIVILPVVFLEWEREVSRWHVAAAEVLAKEHKFEAALEKIGGLLENDPENMVFRLRMARIRIAWLDQDRPWRRKDGEVPPSKEKQQELLKLALADILAVLEEFPTFAIHAQCSDLYLRMGDHRAAADLWTDAVKNLRGVRPETLLNLHAYMRACANLDLEEALVDVNSALEFLPAASQTRTAVIDTRGYIHYRLGNYEDALKDINEAIEGFHEQTYDPWVGKAKAGGEDADEVREIDISIREQLATMVYHRMLVYQATKEQAKADKDLAELESLLPGYDGRELW